MDVIKEMYGKYTAVDGSKKAFYVYPRTRDKKKRKKMILEVAKITKKSQSEYSAEMVWIRDEGDEYALYTQPVNGGEMAIAIVRKPR